MIFEYQISTPKENFYNIAPQVREAVTRLLLYQSDIHIKRRVGFCINGLFTYTCVC